MAEARITFEKSNDVHTLTVKKPDSELVFSFSDEEKSEFALSLVEGKPSRIWVRIVEKVGDVAIIILLREVILEWIRS